MQSQWDVHYAQSSMEVDRNMEILEHEQITLAAEPTTVLNGLWVALSNDFLSLVGWFANDFNELRIGEPHH